MFNGDRVTFAKTYVRKRNKQQEIDKNQLSLFPDGTQKIDENER